MTDKQEAIDKIDVCLSSWYAVGGCEGTKGPDHETAEALYACIAPLRGEFPEEEITALLDKHGYAVMSNGSESMVTPWVKKFKRLWEGDHIAEKVCQTCGESKETSTMIHDTSLRGHGYIAPYIRKIHCPDCCKHKNTKDDGINPPETWCLDCLQYVNNPDCKGTGECWHKGNIWYPPHDGQVQLPYCRDCHEYVDEQRSGEERREVSRRDPIMERRHNPKSGRNYAQRSDDRRILEVRRNNDRERALSSK